MSVYIMHVIRLSRFGLRCFLCAVADNAIPNALVFAFNAPFFQQGFAFWSFKDLLCPMYPTASQSYGHVRHS